MVAVKMCESHRTNLEESGVIHPLYKCRNTTTDIKCCLCGKVAYWANFLLSNEEGKLVEDMLG